MNRINTDLNGAGMRVAVVASRFNEAIVGPALLACIKRLTERGVADSDVDIVHVPGALEIPLALQMLANREKELKPRYDALVALGAVIRGETYHFEVVCNESARGVMDVSLHTGIPVANGILTCNTDEQALSRAAVKGAECADVAIEMARLKRAVTP
jgi:6,7-dimethyl-8-ribityllumazine synthase